ncbi:MAG TPA: hypothetical protein VGX28_12070 [Frankiaceae bacterium]|jgi:hypothetical protein|nr:hypothetical protein [Frankiaceae bacterium]
MKSTRSLHLVKESLTELTPEELRSAVAGTFDPTELCNPCVFTWSCDHTYSLKC